MAAKLAVSVKYRDAYPFVSLLCPFCVLLFIYASPGETEKLLLIPGPCFSSLSPLSLSFTTEISQQCQEAGMPWEGKNSLQWQRSLLLLLVCLQLSRQRIHERGLIYLGNAKPVKPSGASSVVNLTEHGALGLAGIFDCHSQL